MHCLRVENIPQMVICTVHADFASASRQKQSDNEELQAAQSELRIGLDILDTAREEDLSANVGEAVARYLMERTGGVRSTAQCITGR